MHHIEATGPEECNVLHKSMLGGYHYVVEGCSRQHFDWWEALERTRFFTTYRTLLEVLAPPHVPILLKSPFYVLDLALLRSLWPGAKFVAASRPTNDYQRSFDALWAATAKLYGAQVDPRVAEMLRGRLRSSEATGSDEADDLLVYDSANLRSNPRQCLSRVGEFLGCADLDIDRAEAVLSSALF